MNSLNGILLGLWTILFIMAIITKESKIQIANNGMWILNFIYLSTKSYFTIPICIMSEIIIAIYCSILAYLWYHNAATNKNDTKYDYFNTIIDIVLAIVYIAFIIARLVN